MNERDTSRPARMPTGRACARSGGEDESVYVTVPLAVQLAGVDDDRILMLIANGEMTAVTAGDLALIPMASLRRFLAGQRSGDEREEGGIEAMKRPAP